MKAKGRRVLRCDEMVIADLVQPNSRVLDIGCGDGALLHYLTEKKSVDGRGIELSQNGVNACVTEGLSVIQGDADTDLKDYPANVFDFVILSLTLQATRNPREVLLNLVRIGRRAIISFPNFGLLSLRWKLFIQGKMPTTALLNEPWHSTPNIHLCTILDFVSLCNELGLYIEDQIALDQLGSRTWLSKHLLLANLFGEQGLFVLRSRQNREI